MSRAWIGGLGVGLDGLRLVARDLPAPGPGQVRVKVHASALNYRDVMILRGQYPLPVKAGLVPLCDGAGEVLALGEGVAGLVPGQRVLGAVFPHWVAGAFEPALAAQLGGSLDGWLADEVLMPAAALLPVPETLGWEAAAALPCAGTTAWHALTCGAPLRPGQVVLTQGSGGVSLLALQLARCHGAQVIATTRSPDHVARLQALGAHVVLQDDTPGWVAEVRRLTAGRGVDRIVDVAGPAVWAETLGALAFDGDVALVGALAGAPALPAAQAALTALTGTTARVHRIAVGHRAHLNELLRAVAAHGLQPVIGAVHGFDEAPAALAAQADPRGFGKRVIRHP